MEVKGKKDGSSTDRIYCTPCGSKGNRAQAKGYCQDCEDYLCDNCFNIHTIPRPSQHHVLLDAAHMPNQNAASTPTSSDIKWTIACKKHPSKLVEIFCLSHNEAMCATCAFDGHRLCNSENIKDAARDYDSNGDYIAFVATIGQLEDDADHCSDEVDKNVRSSEQSHEKAIQDLETLRDKLVVHIEKNVNKLREEGKQMKRDDEELEQKLQADLKIMKARIVQIKISTEKGSNEVGDLYIMSKILAGEVDAIQRQLAETAKINVSYSYSFQCEKAIEDILSHNAQMGKLLKSESRQASCLAKEPVKQVKNDPIENRELRSLATIPQSLSTASMKRLPNINIKLPDEKSICHITGSCLLSPSTLLLADMSNSSMKIVDTSSCTVTSSLQLPYQPFGVTALPQGQAAVTIPGAYEIQVISTKSKPSLVRKMKVNGECWGIDSTPNYLGVSYCNPGKVEIMNHSGKLIKTFGQKHIRSQDYVKFNREGDNDVIYVSDHDSVSKWSLEGELINTYKDEDLLVATGLAVTGDGQILVASFGGSIHLVTRDAKKIRTLLDAKDGYKYLRAVCYCAETNKLYVSCSVMENSLLVFRGR